MTDSEKALCACLSNVLLGTPLNDDILNEEELISAAKRHAVAALLVDIPKDKAKAISEDNALQLVGDAIKLQHRAGKVNSAIANLAELFRDNGIKYVLLKGQNCAVRYPKPYRRAIGDIDMYVAPEHFERAKELLLGLGFEEIEETMLHLTLFRPKGKGSGISSDIDIDLELHHDLQRLQWPGHDKALKKLCKEAVFLDTISLDGRSVSVLPAELDLTVLAIHTMSHLYCSGIGLRHVCDWLMRLKSAMAEGLDINKLEDNLKKVGAMEVYGGLNHICNRYLDAHIQFYTNEYAGERMFRQILECGNFGHDVNLGKGVMRFFRFYLRFLKSCILLSMISPLESLAWPAMKLKRAVLNQAHRKF